MQVVKTMRFEPLDGWRAIACLLVVFTHTGFTLGWDPIWLWGYCGVHAFFVLSGFLLFLPFCEAILGRRKFPSIKHFYIRRAGRIFPAYLLALCVFSALRVITNASPPSPTSFLTHALLVFNWFDRSEFFAINPVFWTLAIEAQFYVILPLASWVVCRWLSGRPRLALVSMIAGFFAIGILSRAGEYLATAKEFDVDPTFVRFRLITSYLDLFACGMVVCVAYAHRSHVSVAKRFLPELLLIAGGLIVLAANFWSTRTASQSWLITDDFAYTLGFAPLVCAGLAAMLWVTIAERTGAEKLLALPGLVFLGRISYSIYLFHVLVQIPMFRLVPLHFLPDNQLKNFSWGLISLVPTVCIAYVVYRFVEEPFIRYAAALSPRQTPVYGNLDNPPSDVNFDPR